MRSIIIIIGLLLLGNGALMLICPGIEHSFYLSIIPFIKDNHLLVGIIGFLLGGIVLFSHCKSRLCFLVRLTGSLMVLKGLIIAFAPLYYLEQLIVWGYKLPNYIYSLGGLLAILLSLVLIYSQRKIKQEEPL
jgi:hypothetical protein